MITSSNEEYGFFGSLDNIELFKVIKGKIFDGVARSLANKLSVSEEAAAYVLDSTIGRHLADQLYRCASVEEAVEKATSEMFSKGFRRGIAAHLATFNAVKREEEEERSAREAMGESFIALTKNLTKNLLESESSLSRRERTKINNAIHADPILGGNTKVNGLGAAISRLSSVLSSCGFVLDMVTGDILLGYKGSRLLSFRRALPDGSDPFTEGPSVDSMISFNWEDLNSSSSPRRQLDTKSYEVVAYLT